MSHQSAKRKGSRLSQVIPGDNEDFSFLPNVLIEKCRPFILRYHDLHGYIGPADILWHPKTHIFIDRNRKLQRLFKKASVSRSALEAKENLILIATTILATEILASGFAGWATSHPVARKKAQDLLADHMASSRARLIEQYLYAQIDRSVAAELAPPGLSGSEPENATENRRKTQDSP
jgi:hypothetical protein